MDARSVSLITRNGTEVINCKTVLWAAGVQASPLARILAERTGAQLDNVGRIIVEPDLTLPDHPEVFALGDMAHVKDREGKPLAGVAPVAIHEGRYAA